MTIETFKSSPYETKVHTVCFFVKGDQVLLAMKKRGFGVGKWNGYGGKVEKDETIEQAMVREAQEESTATPFSFQKVATVDFYFPDQGKNHLHNVHAYLVTSWTGRIQETEEMKPQWFNQNALPQAMWPADKLWIPLVLKGKMFLAQYLYDEGPTQVIDSKIQEVSDVN